MHTLLTLAMYVVRGLCRTPSVDLEDNSFVHCHFILVGSGSTQELSFSLDYVVLSLPPGSSAVGLHASGSDQDSSSEVTLQSHDTWGGLGPPQLPQLQFSDEVSGGVIQVYKCYSE